MWHFEELLQLVLVYFTADELTYTMLQYKNGGSKMKC
jgi:hypothetical protein